MKVRSLLVVLIFAVLGSCALAAETSCSQHYLDGQAPDILNPKLTPKTQELCYSKFAFLHSGIVRTPLYSAEHLTKAGLTKLPKRTSIFHPDLHINPASRAELADYQRSGYDRGHMTPMGDMRDEQSQCEACSLANIIPQDHHNNINLWVGIEAATRALALKSGELYVVTGPIFYGAKLARIDSGRVFVPTYIFKAIYNPQVKQAAAYLVENKKGLRYAVISIADLDQLSGISVFPSLPNEVKLSALDLLQPTIPPRIKAVKDNTLVPQPSMP
jgi:endonuclease G